MSKKIYIFHAKRRLSLAIFSRKGIIIIEYKYILHTLENLAVQSWKKADPMQKENVLRLFRRPPKIKTERLLLRAMHPKDARDMFAYASDPEVTRFLTWDVHESAEYTHRYLKHVQRLYREGQLYDWALIHRKSKRMIGTCGFTRFDFESGTAEVGYALNRAYWGRGYAPEAVRAVVRFAFETLGFRRTEGRFIKGNDRSRRVLEKCGMHFEGFDREPMLIKGQDQIVGTCAVLAGAPLFEEMKDKTKAFGTE